MEGAITSAGPRSDPRDSLDDAFRAHRPWLVRRLALVVRDVDEAEDLAQQAFLRAAQHWPFPPEQDVAGGWPSWASGSRSTSGGAGSAGASCLSASPMRPGR